MSRSARGAPEDDVRREGEDGTNEIGDGVFGAGAIAKTNPHLFAAGPDDELRSIAIAKHPPIAVDPEYCQRGALSSGQPPWRHSRPCDTTRACYRGRSKGPVGRIPGQVQIPECPDPPPLAARKPNRRSPCSLQHRFRSKQSCRYPYPCRRRQPLLRPQR